MVYEWTTRRASPTLRGCATVAGPSSDDAAQPSGIAPSSTAVCDPVADEEVLDELLGPERAPDHVVLPKAFSEPPRDYPPGFVRAVSGRSSTLLETATRTRYLYPSTT